MVATADGLEVRNLTLAELADFVPLEGLVWGWPAFDSRTRFYAEFLDPEFSRGVFHQGRLVATHGIVRHPLTVPGEQVIGAGGTTILAIHPEFRGRGLMTLLTHDALDLVRQAGQDLVATGVPHHSRTHLRYGFGIAARHANVQLDLVGQRTLHGVSPDGRLEYLEAKTALAELDELTAAMSLVRNGWVPRKSCASAYQYAGAAQQEGAYGPVSFVLHRAADGSPDGFLSYRLSPGCDDYGRPSGTMRIIELLGTSGAAEAQLWEHCVSNPVVTQITAARRPVSEPVAARLPDPRGWRQVIRDDMILRLLDIPAALAARRYGRDDTVVLEVREAGSPGAADEGGRFELAGGLDGARCRRLSRAGAGGGTGASGGTGAGGGAGGGGPADLSMTLSALGAAYLGDVSLVDLAASGQVVEHMAGSLRRATAMFSWSPAPWLQDTF